MPDIVTLQEAKLALRANDFTDDDELLRVYITAASDAILTYLKSEGWASFWDGTSTSFSADVPGAVKAATLVWIDILFEYDMTDDPKVFADSRGSPLDYPPMRVRALLYGRRDPALA